ncbi:MULTISPECIES: FadR/GntR family transcriptional regulator [Pseudofrankia]|uniref:FadR/GntR family transcriptional regulator n=1 Tax=Pseudofrankia TaxID=2994363 RepID=UPI000234B3B0|nr:MULTISPECIES: FCD domain-containing protein [Pseudofrankia]
MAVRGTVVGATATANGAHSAVQPVGHQIRVPKTAELVAAQLRRQIIKGELREGEALAPESVLMEQFGVSRPTLREAFRVLEAEALISVRRGAHGGARVHAPNGDIAARYAGLILEHRETTVGDVYQASAIIEPPCAALLAGTWSEGDLDRLQELYEEAERVKNDPLALLDAQDRFHLLLVELTGNQTLTVLTGMLRHIVDRANQAYVSAESALPAQRRAALKGQRAHAKLIEHLRDRDADNAQTLWRRHLDEQGDHFRTGSGARTVLDLLG